MNLSATFATLISISVAVAQTTPDEESMLLIQSLGLKDELPKPGYNMDGGSVFDNYVKARRDGQLLLLGEGLLQFEKPSTPPVKAMVLFWCSNLHFTSINGTRGVGYTAGCVQAFLGDTIAEFNAVGTQLTTPLTADVFSASRSLSASYNAQINMFNLVTHGNTDNYVWLLSDSGVSIMPSIGWENHEEGDLSPNADQSSWSATGTTKWVSTEEAALLLNINATDFTPEMFDGIYERVWNDHHAYAASLQQQQPISTDEITRPGEEEDSNTTADTDESGGNKNEDTAATEGTEEEDETEFTTEEKEDESSASNGRRLFVAITSIFSTIIGSSV